MNILVFGNGTLSLGQQERKICSEIAKKGHTVYILYNGDKNLFDVGKVPEEPNMHSIELPYSYYHYPNLLKALGSVKETINVVLGMDQSVCSYVSEYKKMNPQTPCYCMFLDLPMHVVGGKDKINYNFNYSQRYFYWLTSGLEIDGIIWNNTIAQETFKSMYNRDSYLVWYCLPEDSFFEDNYVNEAILQKKEYIIACNRLIEYKGTHLLVEAMRRLPYDYVHIAISGENMQEFYKNTKKAIKGNFSLIEKAGEFQKMKLIAEAYCLVYPQITEWMGGLPPTEAMSVRTPVVAFDYPVLRELYGDCVLWAKPKSISDLRKKIQLLYKDKDLYSELQIKGYDRFKKYFTKEIMAMNLLKILEDNK